MRINMAVEQEGLMRVSNLVSFGAGRREHTPGFTT